MTTTRKPEQSIQSGNNGLRRIAFRSRYHKGATWQYSLPMPTEVAEQRATELRRMGFRALVRSLPYAWTAPVAPLGQAVGAVLAIVEGYGNDPISEATGFYGNPSRRIEQELAALGWTADRVAAELAARGISQRVQYDFSIAANA